MAEDNVIEGWDFSGIAATDEEQPDTGSDVETDTADEPADETPTEEGAEEAHAEESEQEDPAFGDDTEVDMGEGRQALKLSELKSGYMRQSDYTKKTQELATQRKEVDSQLEQVKPMQDWLNFATSNPYLWTQINTAIQQFQQSGFADFESVMQDAEYSKWINGYQAEVSSLSKQLDDYKSKYGELEFSTTMDKTIGELRGEYGDLLTPEHEAELRQQAKEQGISPDMLKRIAKGDLAEKKLAQTQEKGKKSRRQIEAEVTQKQRENRLPPQPNKHGQKPGKQAKPLYSSFEEMAQHMTGG
ncbi:hypothetical protein [Paenibacillus sp. FSL M7-0896]|uniref:hypothetical protein n=1 Tax=Paenibacillus sp. FSL M7-0896 TaxID=2921610 RepID=UPI0030DAD4A9